MKNGLLKFFYISDVFLRGEKVETRGRAERRRRHFPPPRIARLFDFPPTCVVVSALYFTSVGGPKVHPQKAVKPISKHGLIFHQPRRCHRSTQFFRRGCRSWTLVPLPAMSPIGIHIPLVRVPLHLPRCRSPRLSLCQCQKCTDVLRTA